MKKKKKKKKKKYDTDNGSLDEENNKDWCVSICFGGPDSFLGISQRRKPSVYVGCLEKENCLIRRHARTVSSRGARERGGNRDMLETEILLMSSLIRNEESRPFLPSNPIFLSSIQWLKLVNWGEENEDN